MAPDVLGASVGPRPGPLGFWAQTSYRLTQVMLTAQGLGRGDNCHQPHPQQVGAGVRGVGAAQDPDSPPSLQQERQQQPRPPGREDEWDKRASWAR